MAKKKEGSKTSIIVEYMSQNPDVKPKDAAEVLNKEYAIDVSPQYISSIMSQHRRKKAGKAKGATKTTGQAPKRTTAATTANGTGDVLDAAAELIKRAGGADQARAAIKRLEEIARLIK